MEQQIETLKTAYEYINNLKQGIVTLVQYLQEEKEKKACEMIPLVADGIEWVTEAIRLTYEAHKGNVSSRDITEKLGEIVEALENEDYVLVSDLFNYEILPILEESQSQIKSIIE